LPPSSTGHGTAPAIIVTTSAWCSQELGWSS